MKRWLKKLSKIKWILKNREVWGRGDTKIKGENKEVTGKGDVTKMKRWHKKILINLLPLSAKKHILSTWPLSWSCLLLSMSSES